MSDWLAQWYLGLFGAWLAVKIYNKRVLWWREGKQDLKVEILEHTDPRIAHIKED